MDVIIAEKPSVALNIAAALGADKKEDGYISGNGHIVSWCYGHLLELVKPGVYDETYKKWEMSTLPIIPETFKYGVKKDAVKQYKVLKSLMHREDVDTIVCATDAGREGELIFRNVYDYVRCSKPIKRIWVSSMEESTLKKGYSTAKDGHCYDNLYSAALAREHCDWLTGINLTRLFTILYGAGNVMAVGRVMTPTLQLIYQRDQEIDNFVKKPYYTVHIKNGKLDAVSDKYDDKNVAESISEKCNGKIAEVTEVKKEVKKKNAPLLYDLTTLQRECNKYYGYTASDTLNIAQELYEKKLTTYPRTDSTYLTSDMGSKIIQVVSQIKGLFDIDELAGFIPVSPDRIINDRKVTDHHAIIPTGTITGMDDLSEKSRLVFDLICMRTLCALSPEYIYNSLSAKLSCEEYEFKLAGNSVIEPGYRKLQDAFFKKSNADPQNDPENETTGLPDIIEGDRFIISTSVVKGETKPPARYTEDSLLAAMDSAGKSDMDKDVERKGLGTSATRAGVIEKLVNNGYVQRTKKKLSVTDQGRYLLSVVPDKVKSVSMTCDWENELLRVSTGEETYETFMQGNIQYIRDIIDESRNIEPVKPALPDPVCKCPVCQNGIVKGKYGLYCSGKCGIILKFNKEPLTEAACKKIIGEGGEVLYRGLKSSKGTTYDAYVSYDGYEKTHYTNKEGKEMECYRVKYKFRFPDKKVSGKRHTKK